MARARQLRNGIEEDDPSVDQGQSAPMADEPQPQAPPPDVILRSPGGTPAPGGITPGRGSETPRDRLDAGGNNPVAPRKPMEPSPMAQMGSTMSTQPSPGVIPFQPLPGPQSMGGRSNLFGSMGGLKGGGLGIPLDPVSDVASDPISTLIQLLTRGRY